MDIEYKRNKLRKQFSNASEIKRHFGTNAKRISSRIDDIIAASNLRILAQIPAANCHSLTGNRKGQWAMNVSPNHRLIFEIPNNVTPLTENDLIEMELVTKICIVEIVDYH
ncbi:MAG: type II toxin-antitoxin system RelE/ParE family toxin [Aequorivita sp.]